MRKTKQGPSKDKTEGNPKEHETLGLPSAFYRIKDTLLSLMSHMKYECKDNLQNPTGYYSEGTGFFCILKCRLSVAKVQEFLQKNMRPYIGTEKVEIPPCTPQHTIAHHVNPS